MFVSKKFFKTTFFVLFRFVIVFSLFFCLVQIAFAQVEITEIMYDLEEGSDTGREWIEIYNGSGNSVDILGLRLFEAKTTHKEFKIISGDGILSLGEYAIIVADDTKFYIDNPTFSGDVLDSSFSLRQKDGIGERLVIRDSEENDIDSVTYDPLWGASGDGNSLQKINGSWCAGVPTPGTINANTCASLPDNDVGDNETPPNDEEEAQEQELSSVYSSPVPSWVEELKINTYAGVRKRIIVAGASVDFSGVSAGVDEKPLLYARYVWNFGDGSIGEGKGIKHTYYYPGEYVVVLNTSSGGSTATDRVLVEVIPADIVISEVSFERPSFVEIYNNTSYELDLSKWKIKSGKQIFNIPQNTFVRAKKKIIFPEQITKLPLKEGGEISLLYSSGEIVTIYKERESAPILVNKVGSEIQEQKTTAEPASDYVEEKIVNKSTASDNLVSPLGSHNVVKSEESSVEKYSSIESNKEGGEEKETAVLDAKNTSQIAGVLGETKENSQNKNKKEDGLFWGITGVSLLSLIAIYGVLISKEKKDSLQLKDDAGLYNIIEIKD